MQPFLLLAEGDAELRHLYSGFLRKHGYDVAVAENGLDCLRQLKQTRPDALVLDLELIWGGGDGVLGWLREDHGRAGLPVILMATAGRPVSSAEATAPPVVELLAKPFALKALEVSVRAAIAKSTRAQPHRWCDVSCPSELYIG
jgi:DNA-binding response OmpR family regulator